MVSNQVKIDQILQVLKNTFAMSGLSILFSWLPMIFAIFLNEIKNVRFRKFVQTVTTLPNFISWVLVYSIAFALFSSEGMANSLLHQLGVISKPILYLQSSKHIYWSMWLWLTWKSLGWSAIMYIAALTGVDESLYEAAYAALQAQIRPYFLFGTLESIRMLAESNKDFDVSNIIFTFGRLMRYSLSSSKNEVTLEDEIENVKNYLEIQKIRMGERLQYEIDIDTEINMFLCPRFILQPLVENSIVHGISKCRGRGAISISIMVVEEYMVIRIIDNGYGISAERLAILQGVLNNEIDINDFQTKNSGFGIYNVSERIKAYYGKDSRIIISSKLNEETVCTLYLYRYKGDVKDENNDC